MSALDQIIDEDTRNENAALGQAYHDNQWAQTFNSVPSDEKLRASRDLNAMVNTALERRMELNAQHDLKSQQLYHNQVRFQHDEELQPLKEELLRGRIEHETASTLAAGATERYHQQKDQEAMRDHVGFLEYMLDAPKAGTPEHPHYVIEGIKRFPNVLTTKDGQELLTNIGRTNDSIAALHSLPVPEGMERETMEAVIPGKGHVTYRAKGSSSDKQLQADHGITRGNFDNPISVRVVSTPKLSDKGNNNGDWVQIDTMAKGEPKIVFMRRSEYQNYGGKLSPQDQGQRAAPAAEQQPNITQADYEKLESGQPYWFNGKQLIKK